MNEDTTAEVVHALGKLSERLADQDKRQDETNQLMRALIDALNSNSQELLDARQQKTPQSTYTLAGV